MSSLNIVVAILAGAAPFLLLDGVANRLTYQHRASRVRILLATVPLYGGLTLVAALVSKLPSEVALFFALPISLVLAVYTATRYSEGERKKREAAFARQAEAAKAHTLAVMKKAVAKGTLAQSQFDDWNRNYRSKVFENIDLGRAPGYGLAALGAGAAGLAAIEATSLEINPATGLPLIGGVGTPDIIGNSYGFDDHKDMFAGSSGSDAITSTSFDPGSPFDSSIDTSPGVDNTSSFDHNSSFGSSSFHD